MASHSRGMWSTQAGAQQSNNGFSIHWMLEQIAGMTLSGCSTTSEDARLA